MAIAADTATKVVPSGSALGADIVGANLSIDMSDETFSAVEDAWHQRSVLRFRGQMRGDALAAFSPRFGILDMAPVGRGGLRVQAGE